jgi:hypothetical protein
MPLDLAAGSNAAAAEDTSVQIHPDERVRIVNRKRSPMAAESTAGKMITLGEAMQLAPTCPPTREALGRMICEQEFKHEPPDLDSLFGFRQDLHAIRGRRRAGSA